MIVLLRLSIGWQFLYEGLWKFNSLSTAAPWSAEGYLKNAQGPFRKFFRNMTGDPDDLRWLDRDAVADKWDEWARRFAGHYGLSDSQKNELNRMLNGVPDFRVELAALPEGVSIPKEAAKVVKFDAKAKRLICDGKSHMLLSEREALLKAASLDDAAPEEKQKSAKAYRAAVNRLYDLASKPQSFSFKERLGAQLIGNPEVAGRINEQYKGTIDYKRIGDIELYRTDLARYEENLSKATKQRSMQFPFEHLHKQWNDLQQLKGKLIGPVKALDAELKATANKLLSAEQLARGPVKLPSTPIDRINKQTMWGLTILGTLLIIGLATRPAALGGAVMLMMFYLATPPWPGVPELPSPEHSFIVNKNLIEVIALLAITSLPTGQWFGMDSILNRFWKRGRGACCGKPASPEKVTSSSTPLPVASSGV